MTENETTEVETLPPEESAQELSQAPSHATGLGAILHPTTKEEAWKLCNQIAQSDMCPRGYRGKPADVMLAGAMGSRLGFDLMRSLQSIAVINGNATLYGDQMLGLVMGQKDYVDLVGEFNPETKAWTYTAKRKDRADCVGFYDWQMADAAGLLKKSGPWRESPLRMIQWRARTYAIRDQWADVLGGFTTYEDLQHLQGAKRVGAEASTIDLTQKGGE